MCPDDFSLNVIININKMYSVVHDSLSAKTPVGVVAPLLSTLTDMKSEHLD